MTMDNFWIWNKLSNRGHLPSILVLVQRFPRSYRELVLQCISRADSIASERICPIEWHTVREFGPLNVRTHPRIWRHWNVLFSPCIDLLQLTSVKQQSVVFLLRIHWRDVVWRPELLDGLDSLRRDNPQPLLTTANSDKRSATRPRWRSVEKRPMFWTWILGGVSFHHLFPETKNVSSENKRNTSNRLTNIFLQRANKFLMFALLVQIARIRL